MSPKSFRLHRVHGSIAGLLAFCIIATLSVMVTGAFGEGQSGTSDAAAAISQTQQHSAAQIPQGQDTAQESAATPVDPEKTFEQGLQCYQNKDFAGALQHFNSVLSVDGAHSGALKYQKLAQKGLSATRQKPVVLVQESEPTVEVAQDTTPSQAQALYREGVTLYKQRQYGEAKDKFTESLALVSDSRQAQQYLAKTEKAIADEEVRKTVAAQKQAEMEAQQRALEDAQKQESEIASMMQQGQEQLSAGDYDAALKTFAAVLERNPRHSKAVSYQKQATTLQQKQQESLAKARETEEKTKKEEEIRSLVATGEGFMETKEFEKAIEAYQQARVLDPDNYKLYSYVLKAEQAKQKTEEAEQKSEREKERQEALAQARQQEQAQQERRQALDSLISSGRANMRQGQIEQAITDLEKAQEMDPENADATTLLARARQEKDAQLQRQQEQARLEQEQQETLKAQEQEMARQAELAQQFNEALSLYQQKDFGAARERFTALLETDANYPKANRYLELARAGEENERRLLASRETELEKARQREEEVARRAAIEQNYSDGLAAFKARDYEAAIAHFEGVLEIQADHRGAGRYLNKAQVALEEQQLESTPTLVVSEPESTGGLLIAATEPETATVVESVQTVPEQKEERPLPVQPFIEPFTIVQSEIVVPEPSLPPAVEPPVATTQERVQETVSEPPVPQPEAQPIEPASTTESVPAPDVGRDERIQQHLSLGKSYLEGKLFEEAKKEFAAALQLDPQNSEVAGLVAQCESEIQAKQATEAAKMERAKTVTEDTAKAQAAELTQKGRDEYAQGNVIKAVEYFQEAFDLDPNNTDAENFLKITKEEYAQAVEKQKTTQKQKEKDAEYDKQLSQLIPSLSFVDSPIGEVLNLLATLTGLNIVAGEGVDGVVTFNIKEKTVG
ncbi:MAG TPA: tetratricopeptide repeat protein, partial [bacterium]|nr:tetratricopeptide repeat protein [bacterium]